MPVYGVEAYIGECIESLKGQTFADLEFIFVDDCTPDASMDAVEAWATRDGRVRILHNEENLGPGPSRNAGIAAARGEYLSFVDPDDYVAPDFYELLWSKAEAEGFPDIVKGTLYVIREGAASNSERRDHNDRIRARMSEGAPLWFAFHVGHQTAAYRRSFIVENGVLYGTSYRSEDATFLLRACTITSSFAIEDAARYYIKARGGSMTRRCGTDMLDNHYQSMVEKIDVLLLRALEPAYLEEYSAALIFRCSEFGIRVLRETGDERAVREFFADAGSLVRRLFYAGFISLNRPAIRAACEYDIFLCHQPGIPSGGYQHAGDWPYVIREWLRFCDKCGRERPGVRRATVRAIENALESLSLSNELEGSAAERLEALNSIRSDLEQSTSRRMLLRDSPKVLIIDMAKAILVLQTKKYRGNLRRRKLRQDDVLPTY